MIYPDAKVYLSRMDDVAAISSLQRAAMILNDMLHSVPLGVRHGKEIKDEAMDLLVRTGTAVNRVIDKLPLRETELATLVSSRLATYVFGTESIPEALEEKYRFQGLDGRGV